MMMMMMMMPSASLLLAQSALHSLFVCERASDLWLLIFIFSLTAQICNNTFLDDPSSSSPPAPHCKYSHALTQLSLAVHFVFEAQLCCHTQPEDVSVLHK